MSGYVDSILHGICDTLQLSSSLYDKANDRYRVIATTLDKNDTFKDIELSMYPHGSFRLETTVKPIHGNEYDLDFVAELPLGTEMQPVELYNHIYRILDNDGIHNGMVERKNRCIRVNYANDFHLDIMPAKVLNSSSHEIIVPDREMRMWYHHSNPIEFANWFEKQARTVIFSTLNESRRLTASIEPVTPQEVTEGLEPLRKAVQLIKRYRDIYCDINRKEPVKSIVICTLMGKISSTYSDTLQIIRDFCLYVNTLIIQNKNEPFEVKNPVVDEVLTEKWVKDRRNYYDFTAMMKTLTEDVLRLHSFTINKDIDALMKKMFGEKVTNSALLEYANRIETARITDKLYVSSSGTLNTDGPGISVKKNTFYGG